MMKDSIRELMDSCRPHGDDLSQPEMQPLAEQIAEDATVARQFDFLRQLDLAITHEVHSVPIPDGLKERLLAAVEGSDVVSPEDAATSIADTSAATPSNGDNLANGDNLDLETHPVADAESDLVTPAKRPASRSWRLWASLATCAAVLAAIPLIANWQADREVGYQDLVSDALTWELREDGWLPGNMIRKSHPLSTQIPATRVVRRQKVRLADYGVTAYCYDVTLRDGGPARIFVFPVKHGFELPTTPIANPKSTLGKCVAAWADGDLAYVLILDGIDGKDRYDRMIRRSSPFAFWSPLDARLCPIRTV